jgi:PleD family two-component response regulator
LRVTVSFGLAGTGGAEDYRDSLARADEQLYAAKRNGRNRVEAASAPTTAPAAATGPLFQVHLL